MSSGADWKKEREAQEMTVDQAASRLRIGAKYIQGIEAGDYSGWPAKVFSSGYIRSYAKLLGKDPEPVLAEYFRSLESGDEEESSPGYSIPTWVERERERGSRRTVYGMAAVAVLFVGLVLAWLGPRLTMRRVPPPPPAPSPQTAVSTPAPPPAAENAATVTPGAGDNAAPASTSAGPVPPEPPPVPQSVVTSVGTAGPVKSPYQLFLEASEMTWLMYGLDDQDPVDVMLYPGDKISIQATKRIFLKLGNAGGVVGTLNGKLLPPFGGRGQVREIRLGE